jgi:Fe-S cluster biogenesis protein NfuA
VTAIEETAAVEPAAVESALDEIRPHLHGDVELVAIIGAEVHVRLSGSCADCSMRQVTLRTGIERILRARLPAIASVVSV